MVFEGTLMHSLYAPIFCLLQDGCILAYEQMSSSLAPAKCRTQFEKRRREVSAHLIRMGRASRLGPVMKWSGRERVDRWPGLSGLLLRHLS